MIFIKAYIFKQYTSEREFETKFDTCHDIGAIEKGWKKFSPTRFVIQGIFLTQ